MSAFINFLADNPIFLLFFVIGAGFLLGNIRLFGFNLGVAAVLSSESAAARSIRA